jgi:xylan 1,4-beta-xylosidase
MTVKYEVNIASEGRAFPHYWEFCVGSCHAATILREDVRRQIETAHRECGFRYLRFHGLFDDDMSVVINPMMGEPTISFFNIDSIFDFLLDIGMKPFVELGFMPEAYASGAQTCFHYKGNVTPPKEDGEWSKLICLFTEHLIERYGVEEVRQWFFEVWNEPNLNFFFDGTQEEYFHLYEITARVIKDVEPSLKVGGPATSVNAWIPEFRAFCEKNDVPYDFITTHHYPSDDPFSSMGMNGPGKKGEMVGEEMKEKILAMPEEERKKMIAKFLQKGENKNPRDVLRRMTEKAKEEAGEYPLYYTEWNGSIEYDTSYQAAFVAQTLAYNEGMVKGYSYWTVSDIFEEMGLYPEPFKNAFGMMTNHGVRKPVYQLFKTLHEAGDVRLVVNGGRNGSNDGSDVDGSGELCEVLALSDGEEATIIVYNHDLERRHVKREDVELTITGGVTSIRMAVIDEEHTNPRKAWEAMGSPAYIERKQIQMLHDAAELAYSSVEATDGEHFTIRFTAEPESVTIIKAGIK